MTSETFRGDLRIIKHKSHTVLTIIENCITIILLMYPCLLSINCGIYYFNVDRPRFSIKNKEVQYGKYEESTKLEFFIYSFGAYVNETVLINQEGTLCPIKRLNIIAEKIMVMLFKKFIHVNGYRITFETKILTDLDFTKYKIIVENNYGEGVFDFTLQSASKYIYVIINNI